MEEQKKELSPAEQKREELRQAEAYKKHKAIMKQQVEDSEMKARYWKSQWEVAHYTLEYEKIEPLYAELLRANQAKLEAAFASQKEEQPVEGGV